MLLADQDRSLWDHDQIAEGQDLVRRCLRRGQPGPYQPELYDQLMRVAPSPVVALNRAVAVAELEGPATGLDLVDDLELDQMGLFHAIRADLLRRVGRRDAAREAYGLALERTDNVAERSFLERQTAEL